LPQRYWAITIPIFLLSVLAIFAFLIYPNLGLFMTPDVNDLRTIRDCVGSRKKRKNRLGSSGHGDVSECTCVNKETCLKNDY
ncbi:PIG-P domain containing protein, partial [Asbolus verrucosus]